MLLKATKRKTKTHQTHCITSHNHLDLPPMQQTHHLQTLLLPMQHNTYPLGPQNLHLNAPTTVRPKTLDLLPPHTKCHHNPAANKSDPTSTSCTQHITTQNQNQASNSKLPSNTILSKHQPT